MHLRHFAHADVADGCRDQYSVRAVQWAEHDLDRKRTAVLALACELNAGTNLLLECLRCGPRPIGDEAFGKTFGDDVRDFLAYELIPAVAELLLCLHIQQYDFARLIDHHNGVGSGLEKAAVLGAGFFGLGEVAAYVRKSSQPAARISQRCQVGVGKEARAILAAVHGLIFVTALCGCDAQDLGWRATLDIIRGEEARKISADSFLGAIALDPFCAGVPSDDLAGRVQQDDRVILNTVEEHAVLFLTLAQCTLCPPTHQDVAMHAQAGGGRN